MFWCASTVFCLRINSQFVLKLFFMGKVLFPSCCSSFQLLSSASISFFFFFSFSTQFSLFQYAQTTGMAQKKKKKVSGFSRLVIFYSISLTLRSDWKRAKHKMRFNIYKCGFAASQSNSTAFRVFGLHIYVSILFIIGILFAMSCVSRFRYSQVVHVVCTNFNNINKKILGEKREPCTSEMNCMGKCIEDSTRLLIR